MASVADNTLLPTSETQGRSDWSWAAFQRVLGVVILVAAFLKAHQLATVPSLGEGLFHARWFNILVVEFELFFGIWLLFGLLPSLTWLTTVGCFTIFTLVSLYKAVSGEASCGCLGGVTVPPLVTMAFDLSVVGLLIWFRPDGIRRWRGSEIFGELAELFRQKRGVTIAVLWLFVAIPATYAMVSVKTFDVSEWGEAFIGVDGRKTITLEPEKWTNKDFGLTDYVDIRDKLNRGVWLVLLHTHTCSSCREGVRLYRELAVEFAGNETAPKIAMIELPPYETEQTTTNPADRVVYGKLDKRHRWKIKAPAVLLVDNRRVQNVFDKPLETDLIRAIWGNKK